MVGRARRRAAANAAAAVVRRGRVNACGDCAVTKSKAHAPSRRACAFQVLEFYRDCAVRTVDLINPLCEVPSDAMPDNGIAKISDSITTTSVHFLKTRTPTSPCLHIFTYVAIISCCLFLI